MEALPISCCIIAHNEADRIERTLLAVRDLVQDLVLVDSGSTDDTVAIAQKLGVRTFYNPWQGYGQQKRFAEDQCRFEWVLNLDADEVLTPESVQEIRMVFKNGLNFSAYRMKFCNIYPGEKKPRLWADYHNYVRLYDRTKVRFKNSAVHDTVDTGDIPVGQLNADIYHFSARSFAHMRAKLDTYTTLQAKTLKKKPNWWIFMRLPFEYPFVFIRYYFARCYFTGGWSGLCVAHISAEARMMRLIKMLKHNAGKL